MADAEHVKPRGLYVEEAIAAALESRWADAVAVNEALIERHGADEETHNRLGKAKSELGDLSEALQSYQSSLELNPLNPIAQKQVRRIGALLEARARPAAASGAIDVDLFSEEPGKSARTTLTPPRGGNAVGVAVAPGDTVELIPSGTQLLAATSRGVALGAVESKLSHRLRPLMETGNRYSAAVARVEEERIELIVREIFQAPENSRKSSFPVSRNARRDDFRPYAKDSLLSERGVDEEVFGDGDDDGAPPAGATPESEELVGMQELDAEFEPATVAAADDDGDTDDEEGRPEDQY
ncbi:MAG: tetratricopeptide repeat protein [Candidatus Dormibacteraeota bacterium]|uniref:Tetratricopeptide repeat protein n=1 Tax=Candidatus Aeolococcus gillhamiae TaxID=3127015 RepID=A0A934JY26_9BACT|nr:tetratricopeptide repeat protein [Candidatus Dormibacteraeota bacterium]